MTDEAAESALEALLAKSTSLPWHTYDNSTGVGVTPEDDLESDICACPKFSGYREREGNVANAALIVAAVNALPDLLATIRRLREELEEARGIVRAVIVAAGGAAHPDCSIDFLRLAPAEIEALMAAKRTAEAQLAEAREALRCAALVLALHGEPLFIQFSDDGKHIRKWSREPFLGATAYSPGEKLNDVAMFMPFEAGMESAAALDDGWRPPEGWVLVPRELTREMSDAGRDRSDGRDSWAPYPVPPLGYMQIGMLWNAMLAAAPSPPTSDDGWRPMSEAPRDRSYILAIVAPDRGMHLGHQAGRMFVIRHEGQSPSGYDLGWSVYPGFGGCTDHDFSHWMPSPPTPNGSDGR